MKKRERKLYEVKRDGGEMKNCESKKRYRMKRKGKEKGSRARGNRLKRKRKWDEVKRDGEEMKNWESKKRHRMKRKEVE
jgi:hypothetical protein